LGYLIEGRSNQKKKKRLPTSPRESEPGGIEPNPREGGVKGSTKQGKELRWCGRTLPKPKRKGRVRKIPH